MTYLGAAPTTTASRKSQTTYRYLLTAGQSVISGADLNNNTLSCDPLDTEIFMNGLKLDSTDTTITATQVSLATPGAAGDEIDVVAYRTFESADHYTKSTADARYVNTTGDTMTGNLGIGASPSVPLDVVKAGGGNFVAKFQNTTDATPYGVHIKDASSGANGYPLLQVTNGAGSVAHLKVNSGTGHVTMASQPSFHAKKSGSDAWQSLGGTGHVTIPLDATTYNVGGHYNTSNYRFTAPVAGVYFFHAQLYHDANTYFQVRLKLNGSDLVFSQNREQGTTKSSTISYQLAVNDYVELTASISNSDGSDWYSASTYSYFCGHLLG